MRERARLPRMTRRVRAEPSNSSTSGRSPGCREHVGRGEARLGAAAHGDAHGRGGQRSRVVDAVTDHEDAAAPGVRLDEGELALGRRSADHVLEGHADLLGDGSHHRGLVAGEDRDPMSERPELLDAFPRLGPNGVPDGGDGPRPTVDGDEHRSQRPSAEAYGVLARFRDLAAALDVGERPDDRRDREPANDRVVVDELFALGVHCARRYRKKRASAQRTFFVVFAAVGVTRTRERCACDAKLARAKVPPR